MLLNFALAALACLAGWRLWESSEDAASRKEKIIAQAVEAAQLPPAPPVDPPPPLSASQYFEVADKLLFFADRNPGVVIETVAPKPLPKLPVTHGILDLGAGPTVILSDGPNGNQGAYRVGDEFGDYEIVAITSQELVLKWEEGEVRRRLDELRPSQDDSQRGSAVAVAAPAPPPAAPKTAVLSRPAASLAGPGEINLGEGVKACQPGDTSPAGTIAGGYKKVVTRTPFGSMCRWEAVQ